MKQKGHKLKVKILLFLLIFSSCINSTNLAFAAGTRRKTQIRQNKISGRWIYNKSDKYYKKGNRYLKGMQYIGGKWYYFDPSGKQKYGRFFVYDPRTKTKNWMNFFKFGGYSRSYQINKGKVRYYDGFGHEKSFKRPMVKTYRLDSKDKALYAKMRADINDAAKTMSKNLVLVSKTGSYTKNKNFLSYIFSTSFKSRLYQDNFGIRSYYLVENKGNRIKLALSYYDEDYMRTLMARGMAREWSKNLKGKSDVEKARLAHDMIVKYIHYSDRARREIKRTSTYTGKSTSIRNGINAWSMSSAIIDREGVCESYASLYYQILANAGLKVKYIYGRTKSGMHAWNMVRLGGKWYHVDTLADDNCSPYQDPFYYEYFLVSDKKMMSEGRRWYTEAYPRSGETY